MKEKVVGRAYSTKGRNLKGKDNFGDLDVND
jgi:hypothetical protein